MVVVIFKILQVVIALSLLILIHELGHFMYAKLFGIRVDKFYLFFDVGGKSLFKFKKGDTEYGIGWLPLGGYCKISGMIDESLDTEHLGTAPQPWEFRAHNPWQRLLVMAGGVLNNFIFAILAYSAITGIWGTAYIPNSETRIVVSPLAHEMGFRTGDRILALDEFVPEDFGMLQADIARRNVKKVSVLRGADTVNVYIDQARIGDILNDPQLFGLALPFKVDSVVNEPNSWLAKGDKIVSVAGLDVEFLQEVAPILLDHAGSEVSTIVERDGELFEGCLQVDSTGRIGVLLAPPVVRTQRYGFFGCIASGFRRTGDMVGGYLKDLRMVATPSTGAYKSVGSFIAIGQIFPNKWNWNQFLNILALLSIMLGVMNLIPIPGLDGGHILFTLYEIITGRKPGDKFLMAAQLVGMALLIALMVLAFGNDIGRLIR